VRRAVEPGYSRRTSVFAVIGLGHAASNELYFGLPKGNRRASHTAYNFYLLAISPAPSGGR
jgi:hypothetical protein